METEIYVRISKIFYNFFASFHKNQIGRSEWRHA